MSIWQAVFCLRKRNYSSIFDYITPKNLCRRCYNRDMEVYVEYVVLDNFTITFLIAALTYRIMLKRVSKLRSLVAATIGTGVALAYPFIENNVLVVIVKFGLWIVLSLILFAGKCKPLLCSITFLALTFSFGGVVFGISYFVYGDVYSAMRVNPSDFHVSLIAIGVCGCYFFIRKLMIKFHRLKDVSGAVYDFSITIFGEKLELRGLMDSGNRLYDEKNGLPIVVVWIGSLIGILNDEQFVAITSGNGKLLQHGARYKSVSTAAKGGKILLLKPDSFVLYSDKGEHILYDVTVGVSFVPLNDSIDYDAILHPALIHNYRPEMEIRRSA